jgi:hypothetical protein
LEDSEQSAGSRDHILDCPVGEVGEVAYDLMLTLIHTAVGEAEVHNLYCDVRRTNELAEEVVRGVEVFYETVS